MTTHRTIQIFTLLDTLESLLRMANRAVINLRRIGNDKGAAWYAARVVRLERLIARCKSRLAPVSEIEKSIAWWYKLADDEDRSIAWGLTCGSPAPFIARAENYRRAAKALEIGRDTGVAVCTCCHKPFSNTRVIYVPVEQPLQEAS